MGPGYGSSVLWGVDVFGSTTPIGQALIPVTQKLKCNSQANQLGDSGAWLVSAQIVMRDAIANKLRRLRGLTGKSTNGRKDIRFDKKSFDSIRFNSKLEKTASHVTTTGNDDRTPLPPQSSVSSTHEIDFDMHFI